MQTTEHLAMTGEGYNFAGPLHWRWEHFPYREANHDISRPVSTPRGSCVRYDASAKPLAICTILLID